MIDYAVEFVSSSNFCDILCIGMCFFLSSEHSEVDDASSS